MNIKSRSPFHSITHVPKMYFTSLSRRENERGETIRWTQKKKLQHIFFCLDMKIKFWKQKAEKLFENVKINSPQSSPMSSFIPKKPNWRRLSSSWKEEERNEAQRSFTMKALHKRKFFNNKTIRCVFAFFRCRIVNANFNI